LKHVRFEHLDAVPVDVASGAHLTARDVIRVDAGKHEALAAVAAARRVSFGAFGPK